jgi:hypothetical protein
MDHDEEVTLRTGDQVVLSATGECGIIVHTWANRDLGGQQDCYVAFFGSTFPPRNAAPERPPYVLRYAAISLRKREDDADRQPREAEAGVRATRLASPSKKRPD